MAVFSTVFFSLTSCSPKKNYSEFEQDLNLQVNIHSNDSRIIHKWKESLKEFYTPANGLWKPVFMDKNLANLSFSVNNPADLSVASPERWLESSKQSFINSTGILFNFQNKIQRNLFAKITEIASQYKAPVNFRLNSPTNTLNKNISNNFVNYYFKQKQNSEDLYLSQSCQLIIDWINSRIFLLNSDRNPKNEITLNCSIDEGAPKSETQIKVINLSIPLYSNSLKRFPFKSLDALEIANELIQYEKDYAKRR